MVGYKQYELSGDEFMYTVGVQFKAMTASGDYTVSTKIFDKDAVAGDCVYVFNYALWDLETYTFMGYDGETSLGWQWDKADATYEMVQSFTVSQGDNLWLIVSEAPSISGEVAQSGTQTLQFTVTESDYMFEFANPFPVNTTFEDLETFCQAGDAVYVFNHLLWDLETYTYMGGSTWQWDKADATYEMLTEKTAIAIPAGQGAFLMPGGDREWTVSLNY